MIKGTQDKPSRHRHRSKEPGVEAEPEMDLDQRVHLVLLSYMHGVASPIGVVNLDFLSSFFISLRLVSLWPSLFFPL